jgi:hypothetical protein
MKGKREGQVPISIQNFSLAVATIEQRDGWIFGTVHEGPTSPSPRAPWIDTHKALVRAIKENTLPTAMGPFFSPLADKDGLIREVPASIWTEFLEVDRNSDDAILHFVRRYGVFRSGDLQQN